MTRILVLYYSMYGHIERMAQAVAQGVGEAAGCEVALKRVPETMDEARSREAGAKLDQAAPIASPEELGDYDALILGTPTRYGNMTGQMRSFLDQTGSLWASGALVGKVGSAFTSTASQHGGQETTLTSIHSNLLHFGMVVVGVPYSCQDLLTLEEISGGTPYGASTIAAGDGSRQPTERELSIARFQGRHVADVARKQAA